MEDYRNKLEKLSGPRLQALADRYRETIARLVRQQREAKAASNYISLASVVDYTEQELTKKREELAEIEQLLADQKE